MPNIHKDKGAGETGLRAQLRNPKWNCATLHLMACSLHTTWQKRFVGTAVPFTQISWSSFNALCTLHFIACSLHAGASPEPQCRGQIHQTWLTAISCITMDSSKKSKSTAQPSCVGSPTVCQWLPTTGATMSQPCKQLPITFS